MSLIVKCRITYQAYPNKNTNPSDVSDYRIFKAEPLQTYDELALGKDLQFSLKGNLSFLTPNKEYEIELELLEKNMYGGTYKVLSVPSMKLDNLENLSREESKFILEEITTSSQSDNLLDAYPDFIHLALTKGIEAFDLSLIKNVGEYRMKAYIRNLCMKYKYLALMGKIKQYEVDVNDCSVLYGVYNTDERILNQLETNPYYTLIKVLNRSFISTDKLLTEIRPELKTSDERCEFIILTTLELNEVGDGKNEWFLGGDTKLKGEKLWKYCKDYAPEINHKIIQTCQNSSLIYYNEETKELASMKTYSMEERIANFVKEKLKNPTLWDIDYKQYKEIKDGVLTDEQSEILKAVCDNDIVIVNARGGSGKTSVVMALISMLEDNDKTYTLLSPTGRVANRIKEQTNRNAQTIHMACMSGEIHSDFLLIEEGSMIGDELFDMLISAIKNPNCKILINGHLGQISPIQCGCPMRDMVKSGIVPTLSLTKVFRYGEGGLYKMATDADDGKFYIEDLDYKNQDRVSIGKNNDYTYVKYNGNIQQVIDEYVRFLDRGIKPSEISIISPWNVTEFGCININNKIQEIINPSVKNGKVITLKIRGYDVNFKPNDIILNTKNSYDVLTYDGYEALKKDKLLVKEDVSTCGIMNGELGVIRDITDGYIIAQFGENLVALDKLKQKEILLGVALTSYKLQGSENLYTISLITPQFEKSLSKNVIYTDISRARKETVEIICPTTLEEAIKIDTTDIRETNLINLLQNSN